MNNVTSIRDVAIEKLYKNAFRCNNLTDKQVNQLLKVARTK